MRTKLADRIASIDFPFWTTKVGQTWDTFDQAPFNLYNVLWLMQQYAVIIIDPRK